MFYDGLDWDGGREEVHIGQTKEKGTKSLCNQKRKTGTVAVDLTRKGSRSLPTRVSFQSRSFLRKLETVGGPESVKTKEK